jgi:hypothetical protein
MAKIDFPNGFGEAKASRGGPELEAWLSSVGISLPSGISGADLLHTVIQARSQNLSDEEAEFIAKGQQFALWAIVDILRTLETELPGGMADPSFKDLLLLRVKAWAATKRHPGGAASA